MDNKLPDDFDLVIIGTGMIESILSAAASRIGKTVLHVDSNDYYGGQWASFNLKAFQDLPISIKLNNEAASEDSYPVGNNIFNIKNFETKWHIPEKLESCLESETDEQPTETTINQEALLKESRKFNIDLSPKLHYARGEFVELLISSNIARYAEYRSVSRVLTSLNGALEVVPCSRSDVFANNKVSVIEKRMLMKLLTSLDEIENKLDEYKSMTFKEFLNTKKLSPSLIHYVLYAMSRSTDETPLSEGIENTKRFLNSLGRFGKTPFLFSMYGSGETPQAFCRLSAVFGGVFALSQSSLFSLKTHEGKVESLLNGDQTIKAKHFVLSQEQTPKTFIKSQEVCDDYISRAILITDKSVMASEQEHLTLLMYPPMEGSKLITVIEMGSLTGTCPKGYFLVHLISKQVKSPQEDFKHIITSLFEQQDVAPSKKPRVLWSTFFSLPDCSQDKFQFDLPENLFVCSGPDLDLDYDSSIKKAKVIFQKMYPNQEFLPRAPDPEEIVIEGETTAEEPESFQSDGDNKTIEEELET